MKWQVGDGRSIKVSHDPWFSWPYTFWIRSKHDEMPQMMCEMIDSDVGVWKIDLIRRCFEEEEGN